MTENKLSMLISRIFCCVFLVSFCAFGQKGELIFEDEKVILYESFLSASSSENLFPIPFKDGVLFSSAHNSDYYRLYFQQPKGKRERVRISNRYQLGAVATFENEIYYTAMSKYMTANHEPHLTIFRGELDELKVKSQKELSFCVDGYTYAHPNISKDGSKMVIVTNEKDVYHILELKRNENNEWERSAPVFITQLNFKILNPTYLGPDTIYFSANIFNGKVGDTRYEMVNDKMVLVDVQGEDASFNIYKVERKESGTWSIPVLVESLSSNSDDLGVQFIDKQKGYVSTYRYDNTNNIFYFELKE